jgi:hypothetical protein
MLLSSQVLDGIASGTIQLAFRRWLRPSVRAGGTLLTARGQLEIRAVERVSPEQISEADAAAAGHASRALLLAELNRRDAGDLYRIELGALRPDPRGALRASPATDPAEIERLIGRLRRLDAASNAGPWTRRTLELIVAHPALRAARLSQLAGRELAPFKLDVRKLKALGLTESLEVGYRISPRGQALLDVLRAADVGGPEP